MEETGIPAAEMDQPEGIGIVMSSTTNVLVIAHAEIRLSKEESKTRFARRTDDEMANLVFVPGQDLRSFLLGMPDYRTLLPDLLPPRGP